MDDKSKNESASTSDDKNANESFKVPTNIISTVKKGTHGSSSSKKDDHKDKEKDVDSDPSSKKVGDEKEEKKPREERKEIYPPGTKFGYKEPDWSKTPGPGDPKFFLSEIKNGVVLNKIELTKPFYIFGRSDRNDIVMLNPTVSKHHAVLQFGDPSGGNNFSWHLYDMNSSNGTFINKKQKISTYTKLEDGFMFKLGCSVRFFLLDQVTHKQPEGELHSASLSEGSDNDSEKDEDDEDFHQKNLVNSLKQWFQNEGQKPVFDVEKYDRTYECKIRLPLKELYGDESEDFEAIGEGKKKDEAVYEAVGKCWDHLVSIGVTPAGVKRSRNWKENDYYDSDEDPFFDRTGDLEKKRQKRMKADKSSDLKSHSNKSCDS